VGWGGGDEYKIAHRQGNWEGSKRALSHYAGERFQNPLPLSLAAVELLYKQNILE
jgi:hypothetical protein